MKCTITLLFIALVAFCNTALAFQIVNNTNSQIFYTREQQVINSGTRYTPVRQDDTVVFLSWAKQDDNGTHWNPKELVKCPVVANKDIVVSGTCVDMKVDLQTNTVSCANNVKTPSCSSQ